MADGAAAGKLANALSRDALANLEIALNAFAPRVRHRGRDYVRERRVQEIAIGPDAVTAIVEGTEDYRVAWHLDGGRWTPSCTCPVRPWCKHAFALAWSVVREARQPAPAVSPPSPRDRPVSPTSPANAVLRTLQRASGPWERQQALTRVLPKDQLYQLHVSRLEFEQLLTEPDADLFCWHLATLLGGRVRGPLADALATYRNRSDLAARRAEAVRAAVRHDLLAWVDRPRPAGERRLRAVLAFRRNPDGSLGIVVEPRLTTARLADEPRTLLQLQQLRTEVRAHPWILSVPESALLTALTDGASALGSPAFRDLLERFADTPLLSWTDDVPPPAAACGVVPGSAVRLLPESAHLVPWCEERDGAPWLELRFVWSDGSSCAPGEAIYLESRNPYGAADPVSLVIARGAFSRVLEVPPAHLIERMRDVSLPIPPAERADVLGRLAARFPHVARTLAAHTKLHAVRPMVVLDLRDDGWLALRVLGHDDPGWTPDRPPPHDRFVFEYVPPGRWTRVDVADERQLAPLTQPPPIAEPGEAAASPADAWFDLPDPIAVEPVVAWLAGIAQTRTMRDGQAGWWLHAAGRRLDALADAWEARPPDVAFFGNERVRRLLSSPRVAPRVRVHRSGVDWLAVSAEWEAEGRALTDADLAALRTATRRFVKLPSTGEWVRRDVVEARDEAARVLATLGLEAGNGEERLTVWQLAGASDASLDALERFGADAETMAAVREIRRRVAAFTGLPSVEPPTGLRGELRPYQRTGVDFLAHAASLGLGAILADDMGLGKTVQALAWLEHLRAAEPDGGPSLVVCPASVMGNWAREAARFVPGLRVLVLGRGPERHALRRALAEHDVVVTNYALLRRDAEEWSTIALRAAILDEAQNVKNPDAAVTRAALALRARHRLALTGTPLENRPLDLWSIASFVAPGYLGTRAAFSARFDRADGPPHTRTLLAAKLRPILLRRLKREVAPELPDRIEERRDCELTPGQRKLYLAELRRSRAILERLPDARAMARSRIDVLAALTRLRQLCCHPALGQGKVGLGSGKFEALFELLEPLLAEGHKVLVFSQFVRCLELIAADMATRGIRHHVLTGSTVRRDDVVAAFADDPEACVFLLSLKAGGTGLNLTAASYVVLFDPWWNPAAEAQAIDRTHRIGQDRTVIAYRLVTRGTIEERIVELQARKAAMVRDVLGEEGFARTLTREDLGYLLEAPDAERS
jgi:superfamily II DNA or RNA helicase